MCFPSVTSSSQIWPTAWAVSRKLWCRYPQKCRPLSKMGFLASIPLWLVTILGSLFITVLSFVMILTVYGRFFRLYMYTALAPLPLAAFAGESTQSVGISFLKLCRRVLRGCGHCTGLRDLLSICQYANSSQRRGDHYCVELPCRNSFQYARIGWPYKGSDRIIHEMMGL